MNDKQNQTGAQRNKKASSTEKQSPAGAQVYCGPTLEGGVRQYTVYHDGLPDALKKLCADCPEAKALCVPVKELADTRIKLETKGSALAAIYCKVAARIAKKTAKQ